MSLDTVVLTADPSTSLRSLDVCAHRSHEALSRRQVLARLLYSRATKRDLKLLAPEPLSHARCHSHLARASIWIPTMKPAGAWMYKVLVQTAYQPSTHS